MTELFTQAQLSYLKQMMTNRNKELRHEVSDHLDLSLPVTKLVAERFKVSSFNGPAATGELEITGVGFKPRLIQFTTGWTTVAATVIGTGAADGTSQWSSTAYEDAGGRLSAFSASNCIYMTNNAGATVLLAALTSLDDDGFTVNFSTTNTSARIGWTAYA